MARHLSILMVVIVKVLAVTATTVKWNLKTSLIIIQNIDLWNYTRIFSNAKISVDWRLWGMGVFMFGRRNQMSIIRYIEVKAFLLKQNEQVVVLVTKKDGVNRCCVDYWKFDRIYFILNNASLWWLPFRYFVRGRNNDNYRLFAPEITKVIVFSLRNNERTKSKIVIFSLFRHFAPKLRKHENVTIFVISYFRYFGAKIG